MSRRKQEKPQPRKNLIKGKPVLKFLNGGALKYPVPKFGTPTFDFYSSPSFLPYVHSEYPMVNFYVWQPVDNSY